MFFLSLGFLLSKKNEKEKMCLSKFGVKSFHFLSFKQIETTQL